MPLEDSPRSYSMRGYLDTSVWVYPELDLVVARMQRKVYLHASRAYDLDEATALLRKVVGNR